MARVVAHVDLDCFYVAVERGLDPSLDAVPCAVVQYNPFGDLSTRAHTQPRRINASNGSIIALSYEAKARGVRRTMRGDEARKVCPQIQLVQVPTAHGKADLTVYRKAGAQVLRILNVEGVVCERASIDEVYLDLTAKAKDTLKSRDFAELVAEARTTKLAGQEQGAVQHTGRGAAELSVAIDEASGQRLLDESLVWWDRPSEDWSETDKLLVCGAVVIGTLRNEVTRQLGYSCSAGIAVNKMLAKLGSGLHKPNQQTLVPMSIVPSLMQTLPLSRVKMMGGKLGDRIQKELGVVVVADLLQFSEKQLRERFGDATAMWLHKIARGVEEEPVRVNWLTFVVRPTSFYLTEFEYADLLAQAQRWLDELASELFERMEADRDENNRIPTQLSLYANVVSSTNQPANWQDGEGLSRNCPLRPTLAHMCQDLGAMLQRLLQDRKQWGVMALGAAVANFVSLERNTKSILHFVRPAAADERADVDVEQPSAFQEIVEKIGGADVCLDNGVGEGDGLSATNEEKLPEVDPVTEAATKGFDPAFFVELPPEIQQELLKHGQAAYEASAAQTSGPRSAKRKSQSAIGGIARFLVPQPSSSPRSSKREKNS